MEIKKVQSIQGENSRCGIPHSPSQKGPWQKRDCTIKGGMDGEGEET